MSTVFSFIILIYNHLLVSGHFSLILSASLVVMKCCNASLIPSAPYNNTPRGMRLSGHNPFNLIIFSLSCLNTFYIFIILDTNDILFLVISIYFFVIYYNLLNGLPVILIDYEIYYDYLLFLLSSSSSSKNSSPGLGYNT